MPKLKIEIEANEMKNNFIHKWVSGKNKHMWVLIRCLLSILQIYDYFFAGIQSTQYQAFFNEYRIRFWSFFSPSTHILPNLEGQQEAHKLSQPTYINMHKPSLQTSAASRSWGQEPDVGT